MYIIARPRLVSYFFFITFIIPNLVYPMHTNLNNSQTIFYTKATKTVLQKTFHVLERGEIPEDMEDLTPSSAGRKPNSPLYTKKMCIDLIQNRMSEYVTPCFESKHHASLFLEHGTLLTNKKFENCIYTDVQNQYTDKDETKLQNFYKYLITATINAFNDISAKIETAQTTPIAKSSTQVVTTNQSSPWYIRARKRVEKTVVPYLPVTAQEVFFIDKEVDKYIADLPRLVEEEKETIFQEQAQKYEQLWTHTKPHKKQKNWLALIHQYKKHQDTILFFAEHHKSIELYMLATAYIKAKSIPPLLRTEKQSWLIPTMEQWAFQQYIARKKRNLQKSQIKNIQKQGKSFTCSIEWKINTHDEENRSRYEAIYDTKEEDTPKCDSNVKKRSTLTHRLLLKKNLRPKIRLKKSFFNKKNYGDNKKRYTKDILNNKTLFEKNILYASQDLKYHNMYQDKIWSLIAITHQVTWFTDTIHEKQLVYATAPYIFSIFVSNCQMMFNNKNLSQN